MNGAALIHAQVQRLRLDFRLFPVTASEIEFYLTGADACGTLDDFWSEVTVTCANHGIALFNTSKEKGREQFEVSLQPSKDPEKTAQDTYELKQILTQKAVRHGMVTDFSAKPFDDQPGSGLHIHVHLVDTLGNNVFFKDDYAISAALQHSIAGMLEWVLDSMVVFAPKEESYKRFFPKSNAPLTVSWGGNNRTVAIRLPDAAHDNKHIEHRVAGADADPALVIAVILAAMHCGITKRGDPGPQVFGDASLPMYSLPRFPATLAEAKQRLHETLIMHGYFTTADLLPAP